VRLFDPSGEEYDRLDHDASRAAIEEALTRNAAEIVIADCSAALQWHTGVEARRAWTRRPDEERDHVRRVHTRARAPATFGTTEP